MLGTWFHGVRAARDVEMPARMQSMTFSRDDIDVMNRSARLRAGALAVAVGLAITVLTYFVVKSVVAPETITNVGPGYANAPYQNAWKMIYASSGVAGLVAGMLTFAISKRRR
jgi:hypothetical protein